MAILSNQGGHSADVKMRLLVNGRSLAVAQMGPDFLFVDTPFEHPPGQASLTLQVDYSQRTWEVHLPQGITAKSKRILIAPTPSSLSG